MPNNSKFHVSILGSCISRDILGINNDNKFVVDRFVQSISPISAVNNPFLTCDFNEIIKNSLTDKSISTFNKRNLSLDLTGQVFDYLFEVKSDYLIIDLSSCRYNIFKWSDNRYLSKPNGNVYQLMMKNIFDTYQLPESIEIVSSTEHIMLLLEKCLPIYLKKLLKHYSYNQIILVETAPVEYCINRSGALELFDKKTTEIWRRRMEYGFSVIKSLLEKEGKANVICFPEYVLGDAEHKWGKARLHYIKEYYEYAYKSLLLLVEKNKQNNISESVLTLREDCNKKCLQYYSSALEKMSLYTYKLERTKSNLLSYCEYYRDLLMNRNKLEKAVSLISGRYNGRCAFYGLSQIAIFFIDYFEKYGITIDFVVENGGSDLYKGKIARLRRAADNYPNTNVIIIADISNTEKIRHRLQHSTSVPLLDVFELIH